MSKKIGPVLLALLMILALLAACGDATATTAPAASTQAAGTAAGGTTQAASTEPVKLTMSIWGSDTHVKMYQDMAAKFKQLRPNISVEIQTIPFADYQQKISIQIASKTAPDIAWISDRMIPQFVESNQLTDLSAIKTDTAYNLGDFFPSTLSLFTKGNQLLGIPFSTPPQLLFYNKTLFQKKGLQTPTELFKAGKWDYDAMVSAAKAITDPSQGIYGVRLVREWTNWEGALTPLIWAQGGDIFNKDGTQFTLNSPEGAKALQIYNDMIFKDHVHPKPGDQTTFESGKLGMYMDVYSNVTNARKIKDFDWDIAPLPVGPSGASAPLGLAGYTILQGSRHPQEALEFLKFVSNQDNMGITSKYFVPSRQSVLNSDTFLKAAPLPTSDSIKLAVIDQMKAARYFPGNKSWSKIDSTVQGQLDRLYTQSASVKDVLSEMEKLVNPLLK